MTPLQVSPRDLTPRQRAAVEAAREAGQALLRTGYDGDGLDVQSKGLQDFVTQADLEAETIIRNRLLGEFPPDGFLGEETGRLGADSGGRWVVDPIDGTTNFIKVLPHWSVSIAYLDDNGPGVGVIFDPLGEHLQQIENIYRIGMDYRRYRSAATGLASVAGGRVEAFLKSI